jgi:O-methyltransferase
MYDWRSWITRSASSRFTQSFHAEIDVMLPLPRILRIFREWLRDPKNPERRFETLAKLSEYLVPGYRYSWPNPDWWQNTEFNRYLESFDEKGGFNTHRRWVLGQLLRLVQSVPGDTAECGVYRGSSSHLILEANSRVESRRRHHMFDSFQGVSPPSTEDGQYWKEGDLSVPEQIAREKLSGFSNFQFYPGWIPTRFEEIADRQFCFVHVDVDLYEPTRDSLAFFYSRLSPNAIFLCDDYGSPFCPGATQACDEYLVSCPEKMLALPDGGGFFIKGIQTATRPL